MEELFKKAKFKFGDKVLNRYASEDNPHRIGIVTSCTSDKVTCTDTRGDFWTFRNDKHLKLELIGSIMQTSQPAPVSAEIEDFLTTKIAKSLHPKGWEVIMQSFPLMVLELEDWMEEYAQLASQPRVTDEEIENYFIEKEKEFISQGIPEIKLTEIFKMHFTEGAKWMRDKITHK
jgi:hypothetical protein